MLSPPIPVPRRTISALLAGIVALTLTATTSLRASAAPEPGGATCEAFGDYFETTYTLSFILAFAQGLASAGDDASSGDPTAGGPEDEEFDAEQLEDIFLLVLSPRLEQATKVLADSGPRALRAPLRAQQQAFGFGTELLRDDLGLTERQIDSLRAADLTQSDPDDLASSAGIDDAALERAAARFGEEAENLDLEGATTTPKQERAFVTLGERCGVLPADLDCDDVLTSADVADLVGSPVDVSDDNGTCEYEGPDDDGFEAPTVAVDVYATATAYAQLTGTAIGEAVDDVGTEATRIDGSSTFSSGSSCGATLLVRADRPDVALAVAVCLGDEPVTDDVLVDLATLVLERRQG